MKILGRTPVWTVAVLLALGAASRGNCEQGSGRVAQQSGPSLTGDTPVTNNLPGMGTDDAAGERTTRMEQDMEKNRNADRQKKLVADTERLLALANELKLDVDKSSKDTLSLDVIKKADEIEKLAHSVKEKMKGS